MRKLSQKKMPMRISRVNAIIYLFVMVRLLSNPMFAQNNALDFDGIDNYVNIPSISTNGFTGLTIEAWVYPRTFNPQAGDDYISNIAGHLDASSLLRIGDNAPGELQANDIAQFTVQTASGIKKCSGTTALQANRWYHLAGTYDGANLRLYVNGMLEKTVAHTGNVSATETSMEIAGSTTLIGARYLDGLVDELRIWNDARTEAEIRQNMYRELPNPSGETNLVAYYKLNQTSGTIATDSKGSYNGTLTNMLGSEWQTSPAMFGPKNALAFSGGGVSVESTFGLGAVSVSGECWVYLPTTNENGTFFNVGGHDDGYGIGVGNGITETSGNNLIVIYDNVRWIDSQIPIGTGWHHVAFIVDAVGRCTMYLDGISVYAETGDPADPSAPEGQTGIGTDLYLNRTLSNGTLDEVRIWSDVRTETEFRENMMKNLTGNESGLVAYYNFDNVAYSSTFELYMIADYSGNSYNAFTGSMTNLNLVASAAFNIWLNTSSTAWNSTANWSQGSVPTSIDNVGLYSYGSSDPVIPTGQTINNLLVGSGVTSQVNAGENLTINGNLFNYGTFTLQSNASGTGSLITTGTITNNGTIQVERYIVGWTDAAHGWHLSSSPVASQAISPGFVDISGTISDQVDFYRWSEPLDLWVNIKNGSSVYNQGSGEEYFSNDASPAFVPGKGYLVAYGSATTKTFTGNLNNADVFVTGLTKTEAAAYTGWHLLGNPFPSAIKWNDGNWSLGGTIGANCQIWNESAASYTVITPNGFIPSMNGFMVYTNANGGSLTLPKAAHEHNATNWYKNTESEINQIVLIVFDQAGQTWQESKIGFNPEATPAFDLIYDSYFLAGYAPQFYSISGNENYSLNTLPEQSENMVIPMGFVKNGSTQFSIEMTENGLDPDVYLYDRITLQTHLLNDGAYAFTSEEQDAPERFEIRFAPVGMDKVVQEAQPKVWYSNNQLFVSGCGPNSQLAVYDLQGRMMYSQPLNATDHSFTLTLPNGIYLARINQLTTKIVVTK